MKIQTNPDLTNHQSTLISYHIYQGTYKKDINLT